jgi:hypothetical protein
MQTPQWEKTAVVVKLDMSKVYGRIEWRFLDEVMQRMGFAQKWLGLIMQCLSSVKFSILIISQQMTRFRPTHGYRQGDPLSAYLLIICAEALNLFLSQVEHSGWLTSVPSSPKGPRLNHLLFANNSLLFSKATHRDWGRLSRLLECYEKASGQLNKEKTNTFL